MATCIQPKKRITHKATFLSRFLVGDNLDGFMEDGGASQAPNSIKYTLSESIKHLLERESFGFLVAERTFNCKVVQKNCCENLSD